jgi:hypothetical protein
MKHTDRFLFGIVVGSILLTAVSFVMLLRLPPPTYGEEGSPEGVVHNYLLALKHKDFERAYLYLDPKLAGFPASAEKFEQDIVGSSWSFSGVFETNISLEVLSSEQRSGTASVMVQEIKFYDRGLFSNEQTTSNFRVRLIKQDSTWRITSADSYWYRCWNNISACP